MNNNQICRPIPTPDEIRQACADIRRRWSPDVRRKRTVGCAREWSPPRYSSGGQRRKVESVIGLA